MCEKETERRAAEHASQKRCREVSVAVICAHTLTVSLHLFPLYLSVCFFSSAHFFPFFLTPASPLAYPTSLSALIFTAPIRDFKYDHDY